MNKYQKVKLILLAIFIVGFLFIYNKHSENGRYDVGDNKPFIIDTRTGEIYYPHNKTLINIDEYKKKDSKSNEVIF